jgi:hypothetical protein
MNGEKDLPKLELQILERHRFFTEARSSSVQTSNPYDGSWRYPDRGQMLVKDSN